MLGVLPDAAPVQLETARDESLKSFAGGGAESADALLDDLFHGPLAKRGDGGTTQHRFKQH